MATNLHIDEKLLAQAIKMGGWKTKREAVEEALRSYIGVRIQAKRNKNELNLQDPGDVAEVRRRKSRGSAKPYSDLRKKLGLA